MVWKDSAEYIYFCARSLLVGLDPFALLSYLVLTQLGTVDYFDIGRSQMFTFPPSGTNVRHPDSIWSLGLKLA